MNTTRLVRLERLEEAYDPTTAWERTQGLASLLAAARALPPVDPWDLPDLEQNSSFGHLLQEARARQEQEGP